MDSRNGRFLEMVDPEYFEYQARIYGERLDLDQSDKRAAIGLRLAYFHGLESFLALLCALLQSPVSIPAWLLRYRTSDLRRVVTEIGSGTISYPGIMLEGYSWRHLSAFIHDLSVEEPIRQTIVDGFARTWRGFADDFLSEDNQAEYNSIKHGFRIRSGGFSMAFRHEKSPGVADQDAPLVSLGGSVHGTEFIRVEQSETHPENFRLRQVSKNWAPGNMVYGLCMLTASVRNVVARAKIVTKSDTSPRFATPPDASWYASPWRQRVGLASSTMDYGFRLADLPMMGRKDILQALSGRDG